MAQRTPRFSSMAFRPAAIGLVLLLALLATSSAIDVAAQSTIFVDEDATGNDDGSSWGSAYLNLQDALIEAVASDEIWIAAGTYRPDRGDSVTIGDRTASFVVPAGVNIRGGFAGTEVSRDDRILTTNETILSGDLLANDVLPVTKDNASRLDNSLTVLFGSGIQGPIVLDALTIAGGHGDDTPVSKGGGVILTGSVSLSRVVVTENFSTGDGAGAYLLIADAEIQDSQFVDNVSFQGSGGGIYCDRDVRLTNTLFLRNEATGGGGIYVSETGSLYAANTRVVGNNAHRGGGLDTDSDRSPSLPIILINSLFENNAADYGAGLHSLTRSMRIVGSTIAHNSAAVAGGGIYHIVASDTIEVANTIVWGNLASGTPYQFSILEAQSAIGGIQLEKSLTQGALPTRVTDNGDTIFSDPLFADTAGTDAIHGTPDDNYAVRFTSPTIDAGSNQLVTFDVADLDQDGNVTELVPVDILLNKRVYDGGTGNASVDIGAFEFGAPPAPVTVDGSDSTIPESLQCDVYPNPFRDRINVSFPPGVVGHYSVHDLTGRLILEGMLENSTTGDAKLLDLSAYRSRVGLLTIVTRTQRCHEVLFRVD